MSDTTTSGDRLLDPDQSVVVAAGGPDVVLLPGVPASAIVGRSPGQLAILRLRRDRTAMASAMALVVFVLLALLAPVISAIYGQNATDQNPRLLDNFGYPFGVNGGMDGTHWLGIEPATGRDIFMQLIFGLRTSLGISLTVALITISGGVTMGIIAGYAGGWVDSALNWFMDIVLAFPFVIFCLAAIPVITNRVYGQNPEISVWFRVYVLIGVISFFSMPYIARLIRGQVLSLREREFVEAARGLRRRFRPHPVPPATAQPVGADPGGLLTQRARLYHR